MIKPTLDTQTDELVLPDIKEFIRNCRWEGGQFITPETIESEIRFKNDPLGRLLANTEAQMANEVMFEALTLAKTIKEKGDK